MDPTAVPPPAEMDWATAITTIALTLGPALLALLRLWLQLRAERVVSRAVIEGVEKGGDATTKALIQSTALRAGVESKLSKTVQKVTARLERRNGTGLPPAPLALLLVLALALLPGCSSLSSADVDLIHTAQAVNLGHSRDETLPEAARLVALDAYDVLCQLDRAATGAPIPADVRERLGLADPDAPDAGEE